MSHKQRSARRKVVDNSKRLQLFENASAVSLLRILRNASAGRTNPLTVLGLMERAHMMPSEFVAQIDCLGKERLIDIREPTCRALGSALALATELAATTGEPIRNVWGRVARQHAVKENFDRQTISPERLKVFTSRVSLSAAGKTLLGRHTIHPAQRNKSRFSNRAPLPQQIP